MVAIAKPSKEVHCQEMVETLHARSEKDTSFHYAVLLYEDYSKLDDAQAYDHAPSDMMAIIWMDSRQLLRALARCYAISWDASHDTNWMRLKYFDFVSMGPYKMLQLVCQGLQRHEDITTARWILTCLKTFLGSHTPVTAHPCDITRNGMLMYAV